MKCTNANRDLLLTDPQTQINTRDTKKPTVKNLYDLEILKTFFVC